MASGPQWTCVCVFSLHVTLGEEGGFLEMTSVGCDSDACFVTL